MIIWVYHVSIANYNMCKKLSLFSAKGITNFVGWIRMETEYLLPFTMIALLINFQYSITPRRRKVQSILNQVKSLVFQIVCYFIKCILINDNEVTLSLGYQLFRTSKIHDLIQVYTNTQKSFRMCRTKWINKTPNILFSNFSNDHSFIFVLNISYKIVLPARTVTTYLILIKSLYY